ncbi:MAG: Zn-dependent membrane protease YugP [Flavobacteriales bacterium]|jgi:Zn-dependent membrane protease YugP
MYIFVFILAGAIALIGGYVGIKLKKKFEAYSERTFQPSLSGKGVAEQMLHDNGITDVETVSVNGRLTDRKTPLPKW